MSVLRGVYVSKLRVREIGWKYRNVRNATNLVFTLESGISFMFNGTVQQVKSTKKVQNGKTKALDPGRGVLLLLFVIFLIFRFYVWKVSKTR